MPKVFVSHKNIDEGIARKVAARVKTNGMDVYLDSVDPAMAEDGPGLADYILDRMAECEQLIAVVSSATAESWWVPWEIGVGSEKGCRMASYSETAVYLPTYLRTWPILRSMRDVDLYCRLSGTTNDRIRKETARTMLESARLDIRRQKAAEFHRRLRLDLKMEEFRRM